MLRCSCWLARVTAVLARRGVGVVLLGALNIVHAFIHGTPLDGGGTLDQLLLTAQAWAAADTTR